MSHSVIKAEEYIKQFDDIIINKRYIDGRGEMHSHEFIEIAFVANGSGTHYLSKQQDKVARGDIFIINKDVVHGFLADPGAPFTIYNCIFQPAAVDSYFQNCSDFVYVAYNYLLHSLNDNKNPHEYVRLVGEKTDVIENLFEAMCYEYTEKEDGYRQILKADLIKLLVLMFRLYKKDSGETHNKSAYKKLLVENTIAYLKEHYAEDIKLEDVARHAYMSTAYFSRIFKQESGMTLVQALQKIRIDEACRMLLETNLTISDISVKSGYSDIKYFYNLFARLKGKTPGEFRAMSK